jgi:hypothetical protein
MIVLISSSKLGSIVFVIGLNQHILYHPHFHLNKGLVTLYIIVIKY